MEQTKVIYPSETKGTMDVDQMHPIHMERAFKKVLTNPGRIVEQVVNAQHLEIQRLQNIINGVGEVADQIRYEQENKQLRAENIELKRTLDYYYRHNQDTNPSPKLMFKDIPQNKVGKKLIADMKKHLNKSGYNMRVRGQHINKEKFKSRDFPHGTPIYATTHYRVYIDRIKKVENE